MTHRKRKEPDKTASDEGNEFALKAIWPIYSAGDWPQDMSLDRADIYEGRT